MSETDLFVPEADADIAITPDSQLDRDDRLRPAFVRRVLDAVEADDAAAAQALVAPLHPADIADVFWEVFVVDAGHHPVGTCALSWILRTERSVPIVDVMTAEQTLIPVDMDQEEVALRFQKHALISAAVTDANNRLVGMITVG